MYLNLLLGVGALQAIWKPLFCWWLFPTKMGDAGDLKQHLVNLCSYGPPQCEFTQCPTTGSPHWQDQPGLLQEWQCRAVCHWEPRQRHRAHVWQEAGLAVCSSFLARVFLAHLLCGHGGKCLGRSHLLQIPLQEEHDGPLPAALSCCRSAPPFHPPFLGHGCLQWMDLQKFHVQSRQ